MAEVKSNISTNYCFHEKKRLCQGDILRGIHIENYVSLDYAVVLNQDCDLLQDYNEHQKYISGLLDITDKMLESVLLCPIFPVELFCSGKHIKGMSKRIIYPKDIIKFKNNDSEKRYHYLLSDDDLQIPEGIIDFKIFYTLPRKIVYDNYDNYYLASINELFREHLSQRFANFISRIGLPDIG